MAKIAKHIFVCTNQRDESAPRGSCDPKGKGELQKAFKEAVKDAGLKATVRSNKAGCLDQCEHGPVVVVYPEAVWYGGVRERDVDEIVREHIIGGRPVQRLMMAEECINTEACPHKRKKKKD